MEEFNLFIEMSMGPDKGEVSETKALKHSNR